MDARRALTITTVTCAAIVLAATSFAGTFGAEPIDLTPRGSAPSGAPAVSGDDRTVHYAAFHSFARGLVPGDTNGVQDVFVYNRFTRKLIRASVSSSGGQANGPSANPALDGSIHRAPHCVAFQSQATNLAPGDRDTSWDIYVRDLSARKTRLASKGIGPSAVDPTISGDCRQVAFTAAGRIYVGSTSGGRPHFLSRGTNPSLSRDGSAITWERGHGVWLRRAGHVVRVAAVGGNPTVSDETQGAIWGVAFDTPVKLTNGDHNRSFDVYMRVFRPKGGPIKTRLISGFGGRSIGGDSHNGGITAYAPLRGIVVFTNSDGGESTLYYSNLHTGNIDDLAHAPSDGGNPGIIEAATSARANYVVFSSTESFGRDANGSTQDVFLKFLSGK